MFKTLFRWDVPLARQSYAMAGFGLAAVKYLVDALLIYQATGRLWTPADYLQSAPLALQWPSASWHSMTPPEWLLPVLLLWTLPFVWLGVTMTARRALDAGLSEWTCLLFFVPYANYLTMLALCAIPTRPRLGVVSLELGPAAPAPALSERRLPHAVLASVSGLTIGLAVVWVAVVLARSYGAALFIGAPFVMGAVVGCVLNRRAPATASETNAAVIFTLFLTALALLAVAFEGVVCIVMAFPLAAPLALLGGVVGRAIARGPRPNPSPAMLAVLTVPLWIAVEPAGTTGQVLHEVRSSIEIDAAPMAIWPRVIAFSPIPPPEDLVFKTGIAFPVRARIEGTGVGATRYCIFSTGPFVEPITRWEPGVALAFDVISSPPPMTEWSPYHDVHPPHLDGFLRARRGEFRLVAIDDRRTRLEGRTWYEIEMGPEGYWQLWTDHLIHRIHMRVLDQIKRESETRRGQ